MCYARRQRSSWARIKLSNKLYLYRFRLKSFVELVWLYFYFLEYVFYREIEHFYLFRNFRDLHSQYACTSSLVVQLSMIKRCFAQPYYYITLLSACQEVFQKFFKKFLSFFLDSLAREGAMYYTTSSSVCQEVFQNFFQVFSFFVVALSEALVCCALVDSLHIIALSNPFVKRFLTSFFSLETLAVWHKNVVGELCRVHKGMAISANKTPIATLIHSMISKKSSTRHASTLAKRGNNKMSGQQSSCSHLFTACADTPINFPKSLWDSPCFWR